MLPYRAVGSRQNIKPDAAMNLFIQKFSVSIDLQPMPFNYKITYVCMILLINLALHIFCTIGRHLFGRGNEIIRGERNGASRDS